ncbi:MAG: mechanosensitive ion channel family protein [Ruminococcus sp.]|nr:mechanosensitive ion channel family protein [Ruminococcus sp.]
MEENIQETTAVQVQEVIQEHVEKASGFFNDVTEYFKNMLPLLIIAVIVLVIGIILSRIISRIISKAMKRSNMDNAARSFIVSVIRIVLYGIVVIMALSVLNVPMSSVITILGAAGLAASLALQNCLTNLCGGFIILFSKPFSAGDTVELDGTVGVVEAIGVLYTKLSTFDGKTILIPNGNVTSARLINYTETPTRRVDMTFDIDYNADYHVARSLVMTAVAEEELILSEPAPVVRMGAHKESAISLDVRVWVKNDDYSEVRYRLNETVKQIFDRTGIDIPYNQLDIHIVEDENGGK